MSELECINEECTVGDTGTCIMNYSPDECPHRVPEDEDTGNDSIATSDTSVLPAPKTPPQFSPSVALGLNQVRALMSKEYCYVIGLLGEPDSGKTACLVSLYLLLAKNRLRGFRFADSKSLVALDELSRGARSWEGGMPDQITAHTERVDGRSAGFFHVRLSRELDHTQLHLVVPDLPGEWTTGLIESNRTDRLRFLRSADVIWLMVDGRALADSEQRLSAIHRTKLLIDRLVASLSPRIPALHIVVSRHDLAKPSMETLEQIRRHGEHRKLELRVDRIASVSEVEEIQPGSGIADLLAGTVTANNAREEFWPGDPNCKDVSNHSEHNL